MTNGNSTDQSGLDDALKAAKHRTGAMSDRLDQIEATLKGDTAARHRLTEAEPLAGPALTGYDQIVAASQAYLRSIGRVDDNLEDFLAADELALLRKDGPRLRWTTRDKWTVGLAAVLSGTAVQLADAIDKGMVDALNELKEQQGGVGSWLKDMEESSNRLPIDYTGKGAGGPRHRGTSAGHDIGRPFEAISQIMDGEYRGTDFSALAGKQAMLRYGPPSSAFGYEKHQLGAALAKWVMHLISDVVTATSLPLPGWTALYEAAPSVEIADLFLDLYAPTDSRPGLNLRTVAVGRSIPVLLTEAVVRSSLAWDTYRQTGSLKPDEQVKIKRDEMLLAAHSTTTVIMAGQIYAEGGVLGLRHVNPQLVARVAHLGVGFYSQHRERKNTRPEDWNALAVAEAQRHPDLFMAWLQEGNDD